MHNPVIVKFETDEQWRQELARSAVAEMFPLIEILRDREERHDEVRGIYMRLDTLMSVAFSAIDDAASESQELADKLYGEDGWMLPEESEAATQ